MQLDDRKKKILHAIVDDYIETAEPVASKALVSRSDLHVKAATIRNEMSDLEELGYLEKPHTSAGRIPSDKGYREYVNSLMQVHPLSPKEEQLIASRMEKSVEELTGLLRDASETLAEQTGYTTIAVTPRLRKSYLTQLKMMMIEPGKVLVVVVLSAGIVKDRVVRVSDYITQEQLIRISAAAEAGLCGKPLDEITLVAVTSAGKDMRLPDPIVNQILYEAYVAIKQADNIGVYIDGKHRILNFPEFHDIHRVRSVFNTLDQDGIIAGYLREQESPESAASYMIRIGQEITLEGLDGCSFITTTYNTGDKLAGQIGVIGPKRMEYAKVIANIGFIRTLIGKKLKSIEEENGGTYQ